MKGLGIAVLRSPVARRLLLLFLFTALLPMLVAAWLSSAAIRELSGQVDQRLLGRDTRQMGLQVFDRLLLAKTLVQSWPPVMPPDGLPGQGRLFNDIAMLDEQGRVVAASGAGAALAGLRLRAPSPPAGVPVGTPNEVQPVRLRLLGLPGSVPRLAFEVGPAQAPHWLVALDTAWVWGPLLDASDAQWTVEQVNGPALFGTPALRDSEDADEAAGLRTGRWHLFLAGEFGTPDWVFVQRRSETRAVWFGRPLAHWLALVAAATVLVVASVSLAQVRRTLGALGRLTAGTSRLAGGDTGARVQLDSHDEFGDLARSFNHMAGRIEDQWRSLRVLAEIDRAILGGDGILAIGKPALRALRSVQSGSCAALLWLDGAAGNTLEGLYQSASTKSPRRLPAVLLTEAQQRQLLQWHSDEVLADGALAVAASVPWLAPGCRSNVVQLHCLPVQWDGRTQAVVLLGVRRPLDPATLQPAKDLRERLTVALAAHERDRTLVHRALHDSLTGLANRHGLHERLDATLGPGRPCALLFIDLDRFKQVNDTHGHAAGDELLRHAAQRLIALAPEAALVARPGGDEFVVVWPGAHRDIALKLGQSICAHLALPFHLRDSEQFLGASVGVALAPEHADDREGLMRAADLAMYAAKGQGRGRCVVFTPLLDAQMRESVQLQAELRQGLARDELVLHYQPRVRPHDGRIVSAEALVRWQHPQRGLLYPGTFVALAEESDLIESLGRWVLNEACAQMARWQRAGMGLARVSVNVSPRQLASGRLLGEVRAALELHGVAPQALELEVTESLLVGDATTAREQLSELRRWGLQIALDDFGTGYSSMSTLRQLPIDVMKVDRSFVKDLGQDEAALAVTRAILTLAGSLNMHTVAEGIETVEQAELLKGLGCDELQGYLYAKPLPAEAFVRLPGLAPAPRRKASVTA